jgi:hypothetical protein
MSLDPIFVFANYVEASFWAAAGVVAIAKRRGKASLLLAGALVLFGVSDIIETRTGAWYRPWWLLAMKVGCVLSIVIAGVGVLRNRRKPAD